jgi:hypothetical protein
MSGTASRIPIKRLNEVRIARSNLRQLIMNYGEASPDALLWVDPVQHQMVLDRGSQLVRH